MSEGASQITFDDAAIYFSEEQWGNLEDFQKEIYKELIKEIYETMLFLGYRIPKPEIVSMIERGEDPYTTNPTKLKIQESQPELAAAKKDSDSTPVIKTEPVSPGASIPLRPGDISSSQERSNVLPCQACGTFCNNQCGRNFQWNAQRMHHVASMEGTQRMPYMTPPPPYFNGNAVSPCYANGGAGITHPTSPVTSYANVGMAAVSPHYSGYNATFTVPQRSGNPMYGNFGSNQPAPQGPPGVNMGSPEQGIRRQWPHELPPPLHTREPSFQDRRNMSVPCPACGTFCNNQCAMRFQWEQKRLHHASPGVVEGNQGNRYTSPPNPYFNGNAVPSHFSNGRPGMRQNSPMNVQTNMGTGQLSPQYAGYRRPGNPNSPNTVVGRQEMPTGNVSGISPGSNVASASANVSNQGNNSGMLQAMNNRNQRRKQVLAPYVTVESIPMFSSPGNQTAVNDQRSRPANPVVSSSESQVDKSGVPPNSNIRQDPWRFANPGNSVACKVPTSVSPAQGNSRTGNPSIVEPVKTSVNNGYTVKHAKPSTVSAPEAARIGGTTTFNESHGVKRPAPSPPSSNGQAAKRASPSITIADNVAAKRASPAVTAVNSQNSARSTPPMPKVTNSNTPPILVSGSKDVRSAPPEAAKDGKPARRATPPITISNIRSSGIFMHPPTKAKKQESSSSSSPIIIIDDADDKQTSSDKAKPSVQSTESKSSATETSQSTNVKGNQNTPATSASSTSSSSLTSSSTSSSLNKVQNQGMPQGGPVLVNNLPVQQSSPIIVTGNPGVANASLPVSVKGNQSIMLTFPVTVGSSGIMLAAPMNKMPISQNPRILQNSKAPLNKMQGSGNTKASPMAIAPIKSNTVPVTLQPGQAKPITVNVNPQMANFTGNIKSGTINAVPVSASGNQAMGQTIPIFVDAKTGLILTAPAVANKDRSGVRNATVVTVNGGVVTGNVVGGNLVFSNNTPVNVNGALAIRHGGPVNNALGIGNATFLTVDGTPVTLAGNANALNGKGTFPTILTVNGGLGIGSGLPVNTPLGNITPVDANSTLHVAQASAANQSAGIVVRRVGEPAPLCKVQEKPANPGPQTIVVDKLLKCNQCEESFTTRENLNTHQKTTHKDAKSAGSNDCEVVSKDSSDTHDLTGADGDSPTILYTTQGDDGSTVYVVTV